MKNYSGFLLFSSTSYTVFSSPSSLTATSDKMLKVILESHSLGVNPIPPLIPPCASVYSPTI